ncbi:hypothetical protein TNIN_79211 [Trichonephila inaurata madagascariensis]|uniref:Uncharacterized protein n=1 Tax=Trichonephila inaurata madagascariensis TaxID=2747483 RepID=A0A8X6Y9E3_9ARAC|nr:hypothetical protein TNIN_79211 [Trichonephila inaurata madagascariensis]
MLRRKVMPSCEAWDILKKRSVPQTSQEFVDSKQRLRAALRNIKAIEEVNRKDGCRKYMITDLYKQRKEMKAEEFTSLTRNKSGDQESSSKEKYIKQKKKMNPQKKRLPLKERNPVIKNPVIKKKPVIKEELIVKEVEMEVLSENNPVIRKMSCGIKEELIVEEIVNEVLSASSHLETDGKVINRPTKRKLPRSLLGILETNWNDRDYVTPKRKTKVSQISTVNNVKHEQTSSAQVSKITESSVNNVKQEPSSAQTSETTLLIVNNVEEQKQNSAAGIPKASTSNNSDEELAFPACDPKKNTREVQLLNLRQEKELLERNLKSNCEQKVPPDLDFERFDEYLIDPEENSSQLEDETLNNDNSTGCPAENFRCYGYISPEVWNRNKFRGNVGTNDDIEIPITFENRLLDVPLFVLNVWLDRLEAHMNG